MYIIHFWMNKIIKLSSQMLWVKVSNNYISLQENSLKLTSKIYG
jgi:hypothetical protein